MRALRSSLRLIALGKGALGLATKPSTPAAAQLRLASETQMERLGGLFGATAANGFTICLSGDLGAGKTVFSRGFLRAASGDSRMRVTSPTYLLDNAYDGRDGLPGDLVVHHMDLYRLAGDVGDAYVLDLDRTLAECCCLVEWPDRLEKEPAAALGVEIRLDGACRRVTVDASALDGDHPWRAATEELLRGGEALLGPADDEE